MDKKLPARGRTTFYGVDFFSQRKLHTIMKKLHAMEWKQPVMEETVCHGGKSIFLRRYCQLWRVLPAMEEKLPAMMIDRLPWMRECLHRIKDCMPLRDCLLWRRECLSTDESTCNGRKSDFHGGVTCSV